jgi:8-oxo-dGTP pyrophosphatase MutT (NUDIX family)
VPVQERNVRGVVSAIERFGEPTVWECTFEVSAETLSYWQNLKDRRTAEVVLAIRRPNGRYLLHTKSFYPEGAYRLLSGGVGPEEDIAEAALREAREETGLQVSIERFVGILQQCFVHGQDASRFASYLFLLSEQGGELGNTDAEEDITGYREVTAAELSSVAEELEALPPDWSDWGHFRAAAHRLAASVLVGEESP